MQLFGTDLLKNLLGTHHVEMTLMRRRYVASLRRIDVVTTACACWEFGPPLPPPPPIFYTFLRLCHTEQDLH